jgi:putative nucleotidyltransferase with HDIG domain
LRSLQHASDKEWPLDIRLAALFHDIAKPQTRRFSRETNQFTFYGHEVVGSRETRKILERMKFSRVMIEKVVKLVRWHMFFSDTEQINLSAVRRMIVNVGRENIWDLMNVRICDRIGTGRPKEDPYRLRKYKAMVDEALRDPISLSMMKRDGKDIMKVANLTPGPKVGYILHAIFDEILSDPKLNTTEYIDNRAIELASLDEVSLKDLGTAGEAHKREEDRKDIQEIRRKHHVS